MMPVKPPGTMSISRPLCARAYFVAQMKGLMVAPVESCMSYRVILLSLANSVSLGDVSLTGTMLPERRDKSSGLAKKATPPAA